MVVPYGTAGWQTQVSVQQAPAVEGNRASQNPVFTYNAGPGGLVAGPSGATVGRFAWVAPPVDPNGTGMIVNSFGFGPVSGFVMNTQQGLNVTYLSPAGMAIMPGFGMELFTGGDFWVKNRGATEALIGQKAYADLTDGGVSFAAAGAPLQGFSVTASIAASTFSVTGSIANNVLTVTAVGSGVIVPGGSISGTGIASGTKIVSQVTPLLVGETLGGIGRYLVNIPEQTVASTTVSGTYGTMTVTAVGSGVIELGAVLSGSGVTAGTAVTALGTGTGGTGTYIVDQNAVVSSTTITGTSNVETKWIAVSTGLTNELVKISSTPLG